MSPKTRFTLDQHEQLSLELQTMSERLGLITVELSKAYPFIIPDMTRAVAHSIDSLRCALDDKVCLENKNFDDATRVYYRANRPDYEPQKKRQA